MRLRNGPATKTAHFANNEARFIMISAGLRVESDMTALLDADSVILRSRTRLTMLRALATRLNDPPCLFMTARPSDSPGRSSTQLILF
ncbi:hypothetical protein [Sphingobium sp.]|uniref:hypothetical protein n=1 Tax=Sphingobium sp. TaxID=1912891 RepID=UPI0026017A8F|nr:hypothetical protein [Sphingobium sp.]